MSAKNVLALGKGVTSPQGFYYQTSRKACNIDTKSIP